MWKNLRAWIPSTVYDWQQMVVLVLMLVLLVAAVIVPLTYGVLKLLALYKYVSG